MWCVGASCVVVDAHVQTDRHVDGWFIGVGVRMGRRPRSRSTGGRLRSHPIRSGQIRFDRMCAMWVRSDGRRTPRSQQRVREGGHRVARTTVEDRMNEYVHEWAMQRERECRGSANGGGAVANACMARGCMVWRVVEGSAGLMADWLVCFASENRVMSRVVRWRIVRGRGRSRTD